MKMRNAELYMKEATVIYGIHPLAALKITWTSVKFGKTRLLPLVHYSEMTGAVATKQASVTTLHVSVVWAFLQK